MRHWIMAAVLGLAPSALLAQADTGALLRDQGLAAAITALEAEPERGFERGTLMVLRAWETLGQTMARHGFDLRRGMLQNPLRGHIRQPVGPETPQEIALGLLADLDRAHLVLEQAGDGDSFTLDLRGIWLDLDGDGQRIRREGLDGLLMQDPMRRGVDDPPPGPLPVRFDAADRSWLMARLHAASGVIQFGLAFDPAPVLRDLALRQPAPALLTRLPEYHDHAALAAELAELEAEQKRVQQDVRDRTPATLERNKALNARETAWQEARSQVPRGTPLPAELAAEGAELRALREALNAENSAANRRAQDLRRAISARRDALPDPADRPRRNMLENLGGFVTPLYVLQQALRQQPDAGRIELAFDHWRAMLVLDQRARVQASVEADDDREWLRGPQQQDTALPDGLLAPASPDDLHRLDEAQALLDGKLLIPHPLLPEGTGFSLAAWGETPGPLDPMGVIHGNALWPWLQRGPRLAFLGWTGYGDLLAGGLSRRQRLL